MPYNAKLPFGIYKKHFPVPIGINEDELKPIRLVFEFVVIDNDLDKMNLKWRCQKFLKFGILDEKKCNEIKKDIFTWIIWSNKESFTESDLSET